MVNDLGLLSARFDHPHCLLALVPSGGSRMASRPASRKLAMPAHCGKIDV
jgi:hypothetical protein